MKALKKKKTYLLYIFQLPLEELESQYALEVKKLQELSPGIDVDSVGTEEASAEENVSPRATWIAMTPHVIKVVLEVLEESEGFSQISIYHN